LPERLIDLRLESVERSLDRLFQIVILLPHAHRNVENHRDAGRPLVGEGRDDEGRRLALGKISCDGMNGLEGAAIATFGDAATVGMWAFATGSLMAGLFQADLLPSSQASALFPLLLAYPGPVLFIVGLSLFRRNNNFLASSFCSFGAVNLARGALLLCASQGFLPAAAPVNLMQGMMFEVFAYISISLLLGAFQMNVVLVLTHRRRLRARRLLLHHKRGRTRQDRRLLHAGDSRFRVLRRERRTREHLVAARRAAGRGHGLKRRRPRRRSACAASRGTAPPTCDPHHCGLRRAMLNLARRAKRATMRRGFDMSHRQRPRELRLEIKLEAATLISDLGVEAYSVARRRAAEASSDAMARDWTNVALAISRKSRRRPAFPFSMILHGIFSPVERLDAVHPT
jgi:succinate-acetate transporter protein